MGLTCVPVSEALFLGAGFSPEPHDELRAEFYQCHLCDCMQTSINVCMCLIFYDIMNTFPIDKRLLMLYNDI